MKKAYLNPEATMVMIDFEDILTASGNNVLSLIEGADDGYHDCANFGSMQWS